MVESGDMDGLVKSNDNLKHEQDPDAQSKARISHVQHGMCAAANPTDATLSYRYLGSFGSCEFPGRF
jgi:hypothetical protein